ncbi:unnamed protein product [Mytilus coruscus]|uniref:Uncharacterized protein n=1 Tax=Mytilus coruscus TaxID=42192 RepID=A0A6J8E6L5_MYTCO|nr:unnamed protein product [Mytilus coruscus]
MRFSMEHLPLGGSNYISQDEKILSLTRTPKRKPKLQQNKPENLILLLNALQFERTYVDGAKEVVNTVAKDIETIWRDACTKLDNGHKESGKNISKLNDRIMEMKTKWAAEYQKAAGIPEKQERRAEHKAGTKDKSEISELKRELDDLKKKLDRNKEFRYYRGGHRGRRFNHQYRHYSY